MIQSDDIHVCEQSVDSIYPPTIPRSAKSIPVVNGITPKLPLGAEAIWRHAGDESGTTLFIKQEQLGVCPHLAGVRRDEEWQVADQADVSSMGVLFEALCLSKQDKLGETKLIKERKNFSSRGLQNSRCSPEQVGWPFEVRDVVIFGF